MKIPKQILVVRRDLNMRKGKIASQCAHASMKVLLDMAKRQQEDWAEKFDAEPLVETGTKEITFEYDKGSAWDEWLNGTFTKICVYVESEEALDDVFQKAARSGLPAALIIDSGKTEFNGVPTKTVCAIGPAWSDELDLITGELHLL